ncbi:hypothetical protein GCM10023171_10650 [Microbacterium panaciterrae]|uniref:DUF2975 domain-containing protein n=2 Tax=Microbacterium panaciterrae TaxID=985759 RepID=A0ABP8P7G7_9MICO
MSEAAAAEDRARAEGHQIQACLGLGVTVIAGGIITSDIKVLDVSLVASIVVFSIWLLALIGTLHWSEMTAFATKRSVAEGRVASLLEGHDAELYRGLLNETRFGRFWWAGLLATILICSCVFGYTFVLKFSEALKPLAGWQTPAVGLGTVVAILTVVLVVASGLSRRRAILNHAASVPQSAAPPIA